MTPTTTPPPFVNDLTDLHAILGPDQLRAAITAEADRLFAQPDPPPPGASALVNDAPPVFHEKLLHGIAGRIVHKLLPHTEAHPAAMYFQLLTALGNIIGPGPHIIGHITRDELTALLQKVEMFNGMANRILWIHSQRTKLLPDGGSPPSFEPEIDELMNLLAAARRRGEIWRNPDTTTLWHDIYHQLAQPLPGRLSAICARAEAQVLRLGLLLALLDNTRYVEQQHLLAAFHLWQYAQESARHIFGSGLSADAQRILEALREKGSEGMTRTEISRDVFHGNTGVAQLNAALAELTSVLDLQKTGKLERFVLRSH